MTKKRTYLFGLLKMTGIILAIFIGLAIFQVYYTFSGCGMSVGPVYGEPINVKKVNLQLDTLILIPSGKFGFSNLTDSLPPKLIKFDTNDNIVWAVEFKEDSLISINHQQLSAIVLRDGANGKMLSFFNESYGEPGNIYLTDDFELEYMCLSPM
jgi:hypothetical protein